MGKGIVKLGEGNWAVKDGNLLAAKETNGRFKNAEFTVARGTRATYVGRDGLIKDSNLQDVNLVTNGTFDADSDWVKGTGWSISNGSASYDGSGGTSSIGQSGIIESGKTYKITLDVLSNEGSGNNTIYLGGVIANNAHLETGSYTFYVTTSTTGGLSIFGRSGENFSIDNVSVQEVKTDTPRIDFTDNTDGHLLLEPQSTNLITYSEDFNATTSDWTNTNVSVETNSTISPQGINNAAKITEDTSNDEHRIQLVFSQTINTNYSYSVFVKANGRDYFGMNIGASRLYANFDLTDGSVTHVQSNGTDFNNESASITSFGNGWYKCTLSGYALTTNGSYVRFTLRNVESVNSTLNYLGDGASGVYIWGAQLEALSHPTSYIPTNGSTVTRDGETCLNAGEAADFNSEEGTFYVDVSALGDTNANQISISLSNTDSSDRILIYANSGGGKWLVQYRKNTSSFVTIEKPIAISNQSKIAVVWKSGRYVMYLNGQKATNYTAGSETESTAFDQNDMKTLQFIPNKGSTGNYFYGKVNAIKVYKEALSDSELTTLTS